jgi:hypothetical protein
MQRTLKRELKVLEIVKREAIGGSTCLPSIHLLEFDGSGKVFLSAPLWVPPFYYCWVQVGHFGGLVRQHRQE